MEVWYKYSGIGSSPGTLVDGLMRQVKRCHT